MQRYQENLARLLAQSEALFFRSGLRLKDGRPTPYFANLGVFRTGRLAIKLGDCFAEWLIFSGLAKKVDVLLGPSYKGSAIAQATAIAMYQKNLKLDPAFEYDRKEKKTHGEASGQGNMFVTGALTDGAQVLILDDVGTSMATKVELLEKLEAYQEAQGIKLDILGVALAVDREQVQAVYDAEGKVVEGARGPDALVAFTKKTGLPVWSLLGIEDCLGYLYDIGEPVLIEGVRRPLKDPDLTNFYAYQKMYGRNAA